MSKHKKAVLRRYPNAVCYMSQLSGMFFVKSGCRILAWEPFAGSAWKQAHLNPKNL